MTTTTPRLVGLERIGPVVLEKESVQLTVTLTQTLHRDFVVKVPKNYTEQDLIAAANHQRMPSMVRAGGQYLTAINGREFVKMKYEGQPVSIKRLFGILGLLFVGSLIAMIVGASLNIDCDQFRNGFAQYCKFQQYKIGKF